MKTTQNAKKEANASHVEKKPETTPKHDSQHLTTVETEKIEKEATKSIDMSSLFINKV